VSELKKSAGVVAVSAATAGLIVGLGSWFGSLETEYRYERVVREAYVRALDRDPGVGYRDDPAAIQYEHALAKFYEDRGASPRPLSASGMFDELVDSEEYRLKNPLPGCEELVECSNTGGTWDPAECWCSCPEGTHFQETRGCVPDPTPPDCQGEPPCYVHYDRVDGIVNGTPARLALLHYCPDANWRDPVRVADRCGDDVARYLGFSDSQALREFGDQDGKDLCVEGEERIVPQLENTNRRCDENNPNYDPRFLKSDGDCARSEMRKTRLVEYRSRLDPHEERAVAMRARAGECREAVVAAGGNAYDSIAGFCGSLNRANAATGFTVEDCPQ
jgi:hypothetical protein